VNGREPITRIRAVLVGIDRYEGADVPELHGCVNDVALVRSLLKKYFAVPNEHLRVLVNARATKANIIERLSATIASALPGEVVVFYFSGHGSQIRDRNGDELTDGLDEIICPYDMDWDSGTYIIDDELDELFGDLRPGVLLEAFFDCCFWGADGPALTPEPRPQVLRRDVRYLPPPFDIAARAEGDDGLDVHYLRNSDFTESNVLWGASQEGQPAAEDYIDGRPNGIFTYWGCRFIEENIERVDQDSYTREELLVEVRSYLRLLGYTQTPELSAPNELRAATPLLPAPEWGAWVEAGSLPSRGAVRGVRRRGRAR
jgi:metacaspase-1